MLRMYTPEEVAERLRCSKAAIYRWVEQGRLRPTRVGSLLRFTEESIQEFLAANSRVS